MIRKIIGSNKTIKNNLRMFCFIAVECTIFMYISQLNITVT